jgi:hypothetical protein
VLMITEKLKVPGTNNTVASQLFTPNLETSVERLIVSTTKRAFQSLGLEYGPGHAEVILKKDGSIGVVEVAARGGGFFIFDEMIFRASGFDVIENTIKTESGLHKKEYRRPINKRAVILDFVPTIEGKVKSIDVDYSWMQNNDVLFSLFIRIGDQLTTPKTDGDRICAFLVCGDTLEDARRRLMRAKDKVKIEIE